jgi:tetratricopeptide (TPR) repeat protein
MRSPQASPVSILLQQALSLHQKGQLDQAEVIYKKVMEKAPAHFEAAYLFGMLKLHKQDWAAAAEQIERAIKLKPDHVDAYFDRATALEHLGRDHDVLRSLDLALALKPNFTDAQIKRGNVLRRLSRSREALTAYQKALSADPDNAEAWFQQGNALHDQKQYEDALTSYRKAVALRPDYAEAQFNLGNTLKDQDHLEEALSAYDKALEIAPDFAQALTNRGFVQFYLQRPLEALESYDRAVELGDESVDLLFNRGSTLEDLQRFDEAVASYQLAQHIDPQAPSPHWNESLCRLLLGDFEEGWKKYEWRWSTEQMRDHQRKFTQPLWLGEQSLAGKTILLHAEQGFGDTLQFVRYAPELARRGARVLLQVQPSLKSLLSSVPGVAQVYGQDEFVFSFDYHCPLMSLPLACKTLKGEDIPRGPYVTVDPAKWASWHARLPTRPSLRVGLVWAGNPRANNLAANRLDQLRSISFDTLAPVVALAKDNPAIEFYSLQVGDKASAQLKNHAVGSLVKDFSSDLRDFSETAALISHLDLVITVDTAVCHLAGAMGKPVWLLNRFNTCWRWQLERQDTPWYTNFRIFRQPEAGDWNSVIAEVRQALLG